MKLKIFKSGILFLMAVLAMRSTGFAQDIAISVTTQPPAVSVKTSKDFQGKMDDLRIYSRVLPLNQIKQLLTVTN